MTRIEGPPSTSLVATGPNLSELKSERKGAETVSLFGVGSGAINGYEMLISCPGSNPIGPFVPMVKSMVCPNPSGLRASCSIVTPSRTSIRN